MMWGGAAEAVVDADGALQLGRSAPGGVGMGGELAEAQALLGFGKVQPDLDDEGAVVAEEFLEMADAAQLVVEIDEGLFAGQLFAQGFGVP